jgi:tripartite-type tricarboxylate transporter receptor subunit TctC
MTISKAILGAVAALVSSGGAVVAADFPTKPVTMVIPFVPGGSTDPVGRFLANSLQEKWGQPVVVSNRPGAGSTIGNAAVAKASSDGYTILFTTAAFTTAAATFKSLNYDAKADLIPVAMTSFSPYVVVGGSKLSAKSPDEIRALGRTRSIFLATAGLGSSAHFAGELFIKALGIKAKAIHYKGSSEAMLDMVAGRSDIYVGSVSAAVENIKAGQVSALAILGDKRSEALPDIPTTQELGLDVPAFQWFGVFAPKGTPSKIVEKINADVNEVMSTTAGQQIARKFGASVRTMNAAEFGAFVNKEIDTWKALANELNIGQ